MEERIRKAIEKILSELGVSGAVFAVERPADEAHGDYATNVALKIFGPVLKDRIPSEKGSIWNVWRHNLEERFKNPHVLAEKIKGRLQELLSDEVEKIEVAGPGFVNITLAKEAVHFMVAEADAKGEEWGKGKSEAGKRVMVEYTDPNPFKEMHIGHLMSNTIGEAVSRLIENEGATVIRACYSGDIGPHVAKAIWGLRKNGITDPQTSTELSNSYVAGNTAYETSLEAKAEIDALNQEIYKGTDPTLMEEWRKGRTISLEVFEQIYKILGTHFDYFFFESETSEPGMRIVRDGLHEGIFEESEGAVIYRGEKKGLHTLVFITSKGTPTYEAKDIGLAFLKEERVQSDRSIIMTGTEQIGHFQVFLAALSEIAPLIATKTTHVPHGLLSLSTGKMASRKGNVITAASLIEDIIKKAGEKNADPIIAEQVAIGAIKYMVLRQAPGSNIIFDAEKSLSLEGDSGPYLQYALVRAKSVLSQSKVESPKVESPKEPYLIERVILHFPEVAERAARELAPNLLVNYLTELAGEWNSSYAKERIIGGDHEAYKLMLARAFVNTMTNGLTLLGIPTPERM